MQAYSTDTKSIEATLPIFTPASCTGLPGRKPVIVRKSARTVARSSNIAADSLIEKSTMKSATMATNTTTPVIRRARVSSFLATAAPCRSYEAERGRANVQPWQGRSQPVDGGSLGARRAWWQPRPGCYPGAR
jgi:hypothetical protein